MTAIQQHAGFSLQKPPTLSFEETSIIEYLNDIFKEAVMSRASDIHFEPYEVFYRIRIRVDGVLKPIDAPPIPFAPKICARIKILSGLDIAERRLPQDGRFKLDPLIHYNVDCRVSTCPTVFGEKVVLRLFNPVSAHLTLNEIGLTALQKAQLIHTIQKPQGMVLITGPTGSGKSNTLYAALHHLNDGTSNIVTAEDPVEINVPGINQVNIHAKAGLTFSKALRAFLRQDPDIIMLGEIRDVETAEIAVHAAQTGHLVFSTLHTNSAAETLSRLIYMGIAPYHVSDAVQLIVAQRLVRKLCSYCKTKAKNVPTLAPLTKTEDSFFNKVDPNINPYPPFPQVYNAVGCEHCINGYHGQCGIFEILPVCQAMTQSILSNSSPFELFKQAQAKGMQSLYQAGMEKVLSGITTLSELKRVIA